MSYKTNLFSSFTKSSNTSSQSISTTYTAITGSNITLTMNKSVIDVLYKFTFYSYQSDTNSQFLHVKLQKSNDNFSSNIVDIEGCQTNISGDTQETGEVLFKTHCVMFIVDNLDSEYLRLVTRSYSSSNEASLHRSTQWDGSTSSDVYYDPTLICIEI